MPDAPLPAAPGRALVSRRALAEIVRDAVLGSYGITRLTEPTLGWRIRSAFRLGSGSVRVALQPDVRVDVWVTVAFGLPVAEVARQVDSAVRYGLRRALGRDIGPIAIHVEGLADRAFVSQPPAADASPAEAPEAAEAPEGSAGAFEAGDERPPESSQADEGDAGEAAEPRPAARGAAVTPAQGGPAGTDGAA